ncbi:hypothetical protein V8C42DRAFT_325745 [Trichoderma barbatum]
MRCLGKAAFSRIRLMVDTNPTAAGGVDELRRQLRYLVAAGLILSAFCAGVITAVPPEERNEILYLVTLNLARICLVSA